MKVSDAPLLSRIKVRNNLHYGFRRKEALLDRTHLVKAHPTLQWFIRWNFNLEDVLCLRLTLDFWQKLLKEHEELLINNFVLLHTGLNCFAARSGNLIPCVLPPRTAHGGR